MVAAVFAWCVAFAGYLLFAGRFSVHEFAVAAVLACGATIWTWMIRNCAPRHFAFSWRHPYAWMHAIGSAVPATWHVFRVLARVVVFGASPGRASAAPFMRGAEDDPRERARRASAVLAASLAPDSFVVRAEPGHDEVLTHTLLPPRARDARWLL